MILLLLIVLQNDIYFFKNIKTNAITSHCH